MSTFKTDFQSPTGSFLNTSGILVEGSLRRRSAGTVPGPGLNQALPVIPKQPRSGHPHGVRAGPSLLHAPSLNVCPRQVPPQSPHTCVHLHPPALPAVPQPALFPHRPCPSPCPLHLPPILLDTQGLCTPCCLSVALSSRGQWFLPVLLTPFSAFPLVPINLSQKANK